jgi:hypothetical protein
VLVTSCLLLLLATAWSALRLAGGPRRQARWAILFALCLAAWFKLAILLDHLR